jgi:hypothetical protein
MWQQWLEARSTEPTGSTSRAAEQSGLIAYTHQAASGADRI